MSKSRILIITDEMEVGGSQRQIVNLLKNIDINKYEPELLYFRNSSYLVDELRGVGIPVFNIPKKGRLDLVFIKELYRFLNAGEYDLIHCFSFTGELWGVLVNVFASRSKIVTSIRGKYEWYSYFHWLVKKWVTRASSAVITNSMNAGIYAFDSMGLKKDKLHVVYNGISIEDQEVVMQEANDLFRNDDEWTLTFVGRLVVHKNLPCLIRAMSHLKSRNINGIRVLVLGDGPDKKELQKLYKEYGLNNIIFLGERNDVASILKLSDAAVLPSFREGLSNSILESMAAGLPVIASNVGGTPEIITHNENGLLFDSDDDDQLAEKITELYSDKVLAQRLGVNAKNDIENRFSIKAMVDQIDKIYSKILY